MTTGLLSSSGLQIPTFCFYFLLNTHYSTSRVSHSVLSGAQRVNLQMELQAFRHEQLKLLYMLAPDAKIFCSSLTALTCPPTQRSSGKLCTKRFLEESSLQLLLEYNSFVSKETTPRIIAKLVLYGSEATSPLAPEATSPLGTCFWKLFLIMCSFFQSWFKV